ncbi:hypothetical protein BCIN_08g06860 [Botrytis cinerea B05.10]|uniref:C2H2-type domain-containing protein n=1 Tax=Botryotinia fuckeliana (strain B05.10) TaxID=332648 RepID=A0A384JR63_BOTFB|nr:hypothetical protein BCIN_08g06860 [Botrytis cinerea B05.10]ATZ53075.1 hypothetical protein BCIN_08g06860 [Botrytis cinerea B05.10]
MPKGKEEVMDWLYQFVKSLGEQGIAIQSLSEKFDEIFREEIVANEQVKDEVWQEFINRDDVRIEGSDEEVGVMKSMELSDTVALGYGVRKVVVQAESIDVEMVDTVLEEPDEKDSEKRVATSNEGTAASIALVDPSRPVVLDEATPGLIEQRTTARNDSSIKAVLGPVIPDVTTPMQRSPEPKEQFDSIPNESSTKATPSSEPKSGNKKSYKIADDPRGTQNSQRRLQSLLNAARAEADGFHTPKVAPLSNNNEPRVIESNGHPPTKSTHTPTEIDKPPQTNADTILADSQVVRPDSSEKASNKTATTSDKQRDAVHISIPKHPIKIHSSRTSQPAPIIGYQYQSPQSSNTPSKDAQQTTPIENAADIDYFAREVTRHGPVPGQRKRGRPKGPSRQATPSSSAIEPDPPKDPASMSFSSLAELESFQTPKFAPKKRGRPKGSTVKRQEIPNEPRSEITSEATADTGLQISESGLRTSRRQPKPRKFFTPTQTASPEPEPAIDKQFAKPEASPTPSKSKPHRKHREPIFTSYEDLLREEDDKKRKAGIDGVYIKPLDSKEGRSLARKKTFVVLIKSTKLCDPDLLESRKGTWIEVLAERRKALQSIVELEAAKIAAANEEEKSKKRKRDEKSETDNSKRSKPSDTEPQNPLEVPGPGIEKPLNPPISTHEILSEAPSAVTDTPSEAPIVESEKTSEIPMIRPAKSLEIASLNSVSFPSNEELALEFEKFKALSAAGPSSTSNINPDSFPSNEELALEFEKFNSGFSLQNDSVQNEGHSAAMQQSPTQWNGSLETHQTHAAMRNSLPPASNINSHISPYREQSEYEQIAGRHYPQPYRENVPAISTPSPADRYKSPYEDGRQSTPSFPAPNPWLARDPTHVHTLDHRSLMHQSPVHQSPIQQSQDRQDSWPAGFLPPSPPKPPQTRPKIQWPAGFLAPDALPSDAPPFSPMSIDSIPQSSPASVSHSLNPSTTSHTSQENVVNGLASYGSPQSTNHPQVFQPRSISPVLYNSSQPSRAAVSTKIQHPQNLVGRKNSFGPMQVSSPLSQQFGPMDSSLTKQHAMSTDIHAHPARPEIEREAQTDALTRLPPSQSPNNYTHSHRPEIDRAQDQAPSQTQVQASPSPDQDPASTQSLEESQSDRASYQMQFPKTVEPQSSFTSMEHVLVQSHRSPSIQPASEPIPEPRQRKQSTHSIEQIPSHQVSAVIISKSPETSTSIAGTTEKMPTAANPDDLEGFEKADAIPFESIFARMSSIYNSSMGNLILSSDKTTLKFWSMAEGIIEPIWKMQVCKMAENPIVSMPGSNPMELRLKEKMDDESITVHRFLIARTKEAHKSANEMRANLVTARIFVQMANPQILQAEDPEVIALKPWKCEKCGSRFKNKEGIKYHLSKSQTTCNPNWKAPPTKPRQHSKPQKETPKKEKVTKAKGKSVASPEKEVQPEPINQSESESEDGDSDDSVFEWAAKVAGLKQSPKKGRGDRGDPVIGRNGKVYKSLGGERPALLEIAEIVKKTPSLVEELAKIPSLPQTPEQSLPKSVSPMSKEKIVKDIILCLLRANNNALPGERGLWFSFVACWLKYYHTSKILPEHKLFARALDELLQDGTLSKIAFDFAGARSRTITRSILSDPKAVAPSSADITKMRDDTKAKHPEFYIPAGFSPPSVILDILNSIGKLPPLAPKISETQLDDILGSDEELGRGDSSDDEFKPEVHALDAEDDLEDDPMDLDVDSDGVGSEFSPFPGSTPTRELQFQQLYQQGSTKIDGSQSIKPRTRHAGHLSSFEELERRKRTPALQGEKWSPQSTMLQNSANSAWDTPAKPKRTYKLRERLPEPTTFIQGDSGSWSVRPFGHGVNPIFARPNKITVGNPQGEHYLQQREDSHRPVIHPNKPIMRPSVPSKFFLNKNLQGDLIGRSDGQIEISKTTGQPKRNYTYHTRSQKNPDISRHTGLAKRAYRLLTPDPMDLMETSIDGLTELDILNHYEAKPLEKEIGRQSNPGLDSIPSTPATPGLSHLFFNESAGLWNLAHPFVACTDAEKLKMQWLDRTAFTMETIPYSALEDNDDLPPEQETIVGAKRKRQQKKEPHIGVRKGLKNKWVMPRRLTSAPDDLLGVHRDVRYAAELLGTQMVNYDMNIRRKRQRFKEQGLAVDEEARLTMGIVIIRALLGGLEMNIDWVILGTVFKDYSLNFLRKWWQVVWAKKKPMVDKLTKDFQEAFIKGYRKGQVQSIDYDHIVDYDFNTLIDWAMTKINTPTQEEKVFDLPNSFPELKKKYALVPETRSNYWSEQYYYTLAAVYQRMNLVNSVPFSNPLKPDALNYEITDYALAKSWCRAAAVTPDHLWDSKAANKLLNRLPSAIIIEAREDLLKNKIITKNKRLRTNGRVYNLPDAFNAVFVRTGKIIFEKQYREAYLFKCELDQKFRNGETIVNIPWGVNEGAVLAITNLQANGCIHIQKSNIRANKFGLTEGGYETRLIDKAKYRFQMDIAPTPNYVYNHAIPNLDAMISEPPFVGARGALPVWRSITGEVIEGMWRKVLLGVTGAFVLRSSIDIEGLERVFAPSLDAWEIKQLIDWGVERGVWQKCDYEGLGATAKEAQDMEGWEVGDWWWMIVGKYLVDSDQ